MARRRNREGVSLNFDSFLDVITNCIGVLMVITLMAMINTKYMTFIVRTPFVQRTVKSPVFFECRNNQNIPIDKEGIQAKLKEYMEGTKKNSRDRLRISQLSDVGDEFYQVDITKLFRENVLVLIPKENDRGEITPGFTATDPRFKQALDSIDPERQFVFFLVRPDSYEVFRAARKILWKKDVEVGWEPLNMDKLISFSTSGRKPTID